MLEISFDYGSILDRRSLNAESSLEALNLRHVETGRQVLKAAISRELQVYISGAVEEREIAEQDSLMSQTHVLFLCPKGGGAGRPVQLRLRLIGSASCYIIFLRDLRRASDACLDGILNPVPNMFHALPRSCIWFDKAKLSGVCHRYPVNSDENYFNRQCNP